MMFHSTAADTLPHSDVQYAALSFHRGAAKNTTAFAGVSSIWHSRRKLTTPGEGQIKAMVIGA